jgi:hypothetical protein
MTGKLRKPRKIVICAMTCVILIMFEVLLYPTLSQAKREDGSQTIPNDELDNIKIKGCFSLGKEGDQYDFDIYNGTKWTLTKIRLSIGAKNKEGKIVWQKVYETSVSMISPLSKSKSSITLYDSVPRHVVSEEELKKDPYADIFKDSILESEPEVKVEEVFGYKAE